MLEKVDRYYTPGGLHASVEGGAWGREEGASQTPYRVHRVGGSGWNSRDHLLFSFNLSCSFLLYVENKMGNVRHLEPCPRAVPF